MIRQHILTLLLVTMASGIAHGKETYQYPSKDSQADTESLGKAHLFILAGQSNMVGLNPSVSFTPAVTQAFGKDSVIVLKDAKNSQPISRWVKDWKSAQGEPAKRNGDLYDRLLKRVKSVIGQREIETVTLLWMQGEADASQNQTAVYGASFKTLLQQLKRDLSVDDLHFVIGRLSDYSLDSGKHPQWQAMRDLQVELADSDPLGAWVDTDDLNNKTTRNGKPKNDVHYTIDGYRTFGQRLADKAIELIKTDAKSGDQRDALDGDKTSFHGYDRYKTLTGQEAIEVICSNNSRR